MSLYALKNSRLEQLISEVFTTINMFIHSQNR